MEERHHARHWNEKREKATYGTGWLAREILCGDKASGSEENRDGLHFCCGNVFVRYWIDVVLEAAEIIVRIDASAWL